MPKFIVITGGVVSGVGKGLVASSIGVIMQSVGYNVTFIKIDPYINLDAGTLTPFDHGEVFVLDDGTEVDLDLGNYERFMDICLTGDHSLTTGKIYNSIIKKERAGDYLGKTVQVVPHLTDLIKEKILRTADLPVLNGVSNVDNSDIRKADICIIELGGTVGDIESVIFIEALRQLKNQVSSKNFLTISVELLPVVNNEVKTKPIQHSCRKSASYGLKSDIIVCRCENALNEQAKSKISNFCEVGINNIFISKTEKSVFELPKKLKEQGILVSLLNHLDLVKKEEVFDLNNYFNFLTIPYKTEIIITVIGKYVDNYDCYLSLHNAILFSAAHLQVTPKIIWIDSENLELPIKTDCIIVPGGFGNRGVDGKISAIKFARENNIPFLGICFGFQIAVIEFCKNVLLIDNCSSEEFTNDPNDTIIYMKDCDQLNIGGTMRLGTYCVNLTDERIVKIYNSSAILERHRHRFEVNPKFISQLEENGLLFVGKDMENKRMEVFEHKKNDFFVGVQFHPEFKARPRHPHVLFTELIRVAINRKNN